MAKTEGLRGEDKFLPTKPEKIGMPVRPFLFTIDQISVMTQMTEDNLKRHYFHYEGRSIGAVRRELMVARNIAPPDAPPEWRIAEREFIRWMRFKGFRYYDRGTIVT
jgi:hypothetical protein